MTQDEITRIKKAYEKRDKTGKSKLYSFLNKAALFTYHQREKAILEVLSSQGSKPPFSHFVSGKPRTIACFSDTLSPLSKISLVL